MFVVILLKIMTHIEISEIVKREYLSVLEDYPIESLQDLGHLHTKLIEIRMDLLFKFGYDVHPHYRGEQLFGRDILPGIFRPPFSANINTENAKLVEANGIKIFKKRVTEKYGTKMLFKYNVDTEHSENWDLLFQAQHAGVKTNLVDLSTSIYDSAFFACEPSIKYDEDDAQLWCIFVPSEFLYGESTEYDNPCYPKFNPFELDKSFVCNVPTFIDDIDERTYQMRLFRQHGRLFAFSNSDLNIPLNKKEFWENMMFRVKILPEFKKDIFNQLKDIGICHKQLVLEDDIETQKFISSINEDMKKV